MADPSAPVVHAVVPAAGRGTCFLPITKPIPKGMLPIVDHPPIESILWEASEAGIEDDIDAEAGLEAQFATACTRAALGFGCAVFHSKRELGDAPFQVMLPVGSMIPGSQLLAEFAGAGISADKVDAD